MTTGFDGPYSLCTIEIKRDEDWLDAVVLQRLNADGSISALDLSLVTKLELFIRPSFDHITLIRKLSSDLSEGNELQYDPAVAGAVLISVTRTNVIDNIPIGRWQQFLVATYVSGLTQEFWRGPLVVHPGRVIP